MTSLAYLFAAILGYFLGSLAFAVWIAKANGVNIFEVGSGNPGATNVMRALGKKWGYFCFLLDALKGVVAVLAGVGIALVFNIAEGQAQWLSVTALLFAILGHSFSLFINFRGGKGVATTIGGLFALMPLVFFIGAVVWLIVFYTSRYVSLASIALGVSLPVSGILTSQPQLNLWLCLALAIFIIVRHHSNIRRLLAGTENRAEKK
jgi:glycerol-3-phosphate acyltransferase PlsY